MYKVYIQMQDDRLLVMQLGDFINDRIHKINFIAMFCFQNEISKNVFSFLTILLNDLPQINKFVQLNKKT